MSKLLLVRHGNTTLNSAQRFWGQTDVELGADGVRQAEQLRDRLATQQIDAIYASNLSRAIATAEIIASKHQTNIVTCDELVEINFGCIEGLTFEEIKQRHPEFAELLIHRSLETRFPGGESVSELNNRVSSFLVRLQKHKPKETILIVAHSGTLRLLLCDLLGIDPKHWQQMRLDLASLSILDTYPHGTILSLLNDVSHLQ